MNCQRFNVIYLVEIDACVLYNQVKDVNRSRIGGESFLRLVIDAHGGDNAPSAVIEGVVLAMRDADDFSVTLTGDKTVIERELQKVDCDMSRIQIFHAPEIITCDEQPTLAIRRKKNSSIVEAMNIIARREADCLISAGSTGAVLAGATFIVHRIEGVSRPALAPLIPSLKEPFMLIDCGANADCRPEHLVQFAIMGSAYMEGVMGRLDPAVCLLNNGAEANKGNELAKNAYGLLTEAKIEFYGNREARDIFNGDFDVLVCDGFTGNIILKEAEGFASALFSMLKESLMGSTRTKLGAALAKPAFKTVKKRMDYTEYGGAVFLGVNGRIVKAHGSSDAKAFRSAIHTARRYCMGDDVISMIRQKVAAAKTDETPKKCECSKEI